MQKILLAHGADLPIAEKAGQPDWPKLLLNVRSIVPRLAEQAVAAAIATAQARPVN